MEYLITCLAGYMDIDICRGKYKGPYPYPRQFTKQFTKQFTYAPKFPHSLGPPQALALGRAQVPGPGPNHMGWGGWG